MSKRKRPYDRVRAEEKFIRRFIKTLPNRMPDAPWSEKDLKKWLRIRNAVASILVGKGNPHRPDSRPRPKGHRLAAIRLNILCDEWKREHGKERLDKGVRKELITRAISATKAKPRYAEVEFDPIEVDKFARQQLQPSPSSKPEYD